MRAEVVRGADYKEDRMAMTRRRRRNSRDVVERR